MRCPSIPETGPVKAVVAALCLYEATAIISGRLPTITALDKRHRFIGVALILAEAIHFWVPTPDLTITNN